MFVDQIQDTMLAAAPLADLLVVDFYQDRQTWHIAANEHSEIFGELDDRRNVLVLSMPLLRPQTVDLQILEIALQYSHVWDASSGLRITLEGGDGPFWLVTDIGVTGMDPTVLAEFLRNMVAKGGLWRDLIRQPPKEKTDEVALLSETGMMRI